jgi:enoyl-CoA hydratase/carnithine racemase
VDSDATVLVRREGGVAVVTLNRPAKLNALNAELWAALARRLDELGAEREVRVVVLTGAGRAFCAGADLAGSDPPTGFVPSLEAYETISRRQLQLWNLPQPVIAAVHGYSLGRGMELALWCDIVVASADARFGQPEVRDGSFVASMVPWLTNPQRAKLLMLTGDTITAGQAYELGLVTEVVPEGEALTAAERLARRLAHLPVPTARAVKRYIGYVQEVQGFLTTQRYGSTLAATLRSLSPEELGIEDLVRIRAKDGLKAYIAARDAPFARD